MKLTKIIVSALLVAAMALSMAACDSGDSETTTAGGNNTTVANTTAAPAQTTTAPSTPDPSTPATDDDETEVEIPEDEVYAGTWYYNKELEKYECGDTDWPNFAIIPIGDGVVPDGVTKYSIEVTSRWGQTPEWGLIYGGKDVDGDGKLLEDFDYYRLYITNGKNPANCTNPGKFDLWDELAKDQLDLIEEGPVTMKLVVDTEAGTLEFYLNDIMIDTRTDVSFAEYGNMIGVCSKVMYDWDNTGLFWDLKFTALN